MEASPRKGAGSDEPTGRLNFGRMGPSDGLLMGSVRTGSSNGETLEDCPEQIQLRLATDAAVCGSLGCRETEPLLSVTVAGEDRVLCPDHATDWARSQSDRGLDSAERSAAAEPEARGSGKREERQRRPKTSGGSCEVWR